MRLAFQYICGLFRFGSGFISLDSLRRGRLFLFGGSGGCVLFRFGSGFISLDSLRQGRLFLLGGSSGCRLFRFGSGFISLDSLRRGRLFLFGGRGIIRQFGSSCLLFGHRFAFSRVFLADRLVQEFRGILCRR